MSSVGAAVDRAPGMFGRRGSSRHDSELLLHEVQPAGGNRMSWDAFVRGRPGILDNRRAGPVTRWDSIRS
jgi:hypothetical protein